MWNNVQDFLETVPPMQMETGFNLNAHHGARYVMREETPILSRIMRYNSESHQSRRRQLVDLRKEGTIPESVFDFYGKDQESELVQTLKTKYPEQAVNLWTDEELKTQLQEEYAPARKEDLDVFERQNTAGFWGQMGGGMGGSMMDPLYAGSMFTGYGEVARGASALKVLGTAIATEAAIETVAQTMIYDFKNEMDYDYSGADMLMNVAFSAILPTAITGATLTARQLRQFVKRVDPEVRIPALENAPDGADARTVIKTDESTQSVHDHKGPQKYEEGTFAPDDEILETAYNTHETTIKAETVNPESDPQVTLKAEQEWADEYLIPGGKSVDVDTQPKAEDVTGDTDPLSEENFQAWLAKERVDVQAEIEAMKVGEKTELRKKLKEIENPSTREIQIIEALDKELAYRDKAEVKVRGEMAPVVDPQTGAVEFKDINQAYKDISTEKADVAEFKKRCTYGR